MRPPSKYFAVAVAHRVDVLRADAGEAHAHRRGDAGGHVEEVGARVELAGAVARGRGDGAVGGDLRGRVEELVAADEERAGPLRVRVVGEAFLGSGGKGDGAGGGVADDDGVLEDLAHPLVGLERLAVHDPDRRRADPAAPDRRLRRFLLHQLVDELPVPEVVREDAC